MTSDPEHRAHRLVADAEVTGDAAQTLLPRAGDNFWPAVLGDGTALRPSRIASAVSWSVTERSVNVTPWSVSQVRTLALSAHPGCV